jgi:hypothetical protein
MTWLLKSTGSLDKPRLQPGYVWDDKLLAASVL